MLLKNLLAATLLIATTTAFSQTLSIGPRIGGTLTKFGGLDNASYKTGLTAGAFLVYSKREHTGLGIEILYSGEGSKHENTTMNGTTTNKYEYNTRLHYIKVPFHATYFFNNAGDNLRPKISLGPSVGFLMGTKQNITLHSTTSGTTTTTESENKVLDNYNRLDVGLAIRTGFNYKIKSKLWLNVDLRYNYGILNILKNAAYGSNKMNNQGASLSLGLAYGLDKIKN
ncbi:MAG: porin family protein [Bacteroidia bacterium]